MEIKQQYFGLNKSQYGKILVDAGENGRVNTLRTGDADLRF